MEEKMKFMAIMWALHSARTAAELCEILEGVGVRCLLTARGLALWPESDRLFINGGTAWTFHGESPDLTAHSLAAWAKEPRQIGGFAAVAHLGLDEMAEHLRSLGLSVNLYPEEERIVGERVQWALAHGRWQATLADKLTMDEAVMIELQSPQGR